MFSLQCATHTLILSHRLSLPTTRLPRLISSLLIHHSKPFLSLNPNPTSLMSAPPSAFDVLMSGRRAGKKKSGTATSSSSPKKRKTLEPNPSVQNPNLEKTAVGNAESKPSQEKKLSNLGEKDEFLSNKARKIEGSESPNSNPTGEEKISDLSKQNKKIEGSESRNSKAKGQEKTSHLSKKDKKIEGSKSLNSKPTGEEIATNLSKQDRKIEDLKNPIDEKVSSNSKPVNCSLGSKPKQVNNMTADESVALLKKKPANFDPKKAAFWEEGKRVPFLFLVKVFDAIDKESGRILITEIVCNMLRTVISTTPEDLLAVVYLLANKIAPAHEGVELGIGDASIIKALAEACGSKEAQIKNKYKELGDLGLVAKECRSSQSLMRRPEPLTVVKVFDKFRVIAKESGKDSQDKKKNHIKGLLVAAIDCEPQYLIRLLQSKLRIGLAEQTLLVALGHAAVYAEQHLSTPANTDSPLEEAAKLIKQVYSVIPVYDKIVPALLSDGVWKLPNTCSFTPGVPIGPMLSKPTKGVSEILDKFQDMEFTCEFKYDGERAQIHYLENGSVEIYSRNAEHNTGKFPDVVAAVSRLKKNSVKSFVLDCELVGYEREKKKILPFQILSTRARKNVVMNEIKVDVCIFAFDILYLNGQPLMQEQLNIRRKHLYESFEEEPGFFQFATAIASNDLDEIQKFLDTSVDASCEGLIIKTLSRDATYEPSKRSNNWLKLKKDYMESIGDSLDLVPIAAFHGRGKRTGVFGAFLLACYDSSNDEYQSICKIGTGFSEAMLEVRSTSLRSKVIPKPKPYYRFGESINPDVWFEPTEVWEVKAADLTISPVYRAGVGIVDNNKGISLRFPRLLRVREDKTPEEASSSEMVAEMYSAQKNTQRKNNQDDDEED